MRKTLNLKRYTELLKKKANLNESESLELLYYGAAVECQISYNRKNQYFSLIKEYLDEIIDAGIFRYKFLEMNIEDAKVAEIIKKDLKELSTFTIDLKSEEFSSLHYRIWNNCMIVMEFPPEEGITEDEFHDSIKKIFFEIQNSDNYEEKLEFDLPFTLGKNDNEVTKKTDQKLALFKKEIKDLVRSDSAILFNKEKGKYQRYPIINFYNTKSKINVVFQESTREFITTFRVSDAEETELLKIKNFDGMSVLENKNILQIKINNNRIRHLELLRRFQDLEKQGKSLYDENLEEYIELLEYRSTVQDNIFWKDKGQFVLLMENFINRIIDGEEFCSILSVLYRKNIDEHDVFKTDFEKLEDFQPDLRSKGFSFFISSLLHCECEYFEPDSTFVKLNTERESMHLTEEELKDSIRSAFLEIQKYL